MKTVLDIIRNTFKEDLNPDLIAAIADREKTPREKLRELSQALRTFAREARAPDLAQDELRPYIPINLYSFTHTSTGVRLRYYGGDLDDPKGIESSVDALSQHLLYCHSLAIDNSLSFILDFFHEPWFYDEGYRTQLVHYLHFLNLIKPLIESHVVILLERPDDSGWNFSRTPRLSEDAEREIIGRADFVDFLNDSEKESFLQLPTAKDREGVRHVYMYEASNTIAHELVACSFHRGNIDLYCPFRYYLPVLEKFVAHANAAAAGQRTSEHELKLLDNLINLTLPRIESLSAQDIVNIREADAFKDFRLVLKHTLERMENVSLGFNREAAQIRVLNEEILDASKRLGVQLQSSSFPKRAQKGIRSFAIGALAGLAALPLDPTASSAAALTTGAVDAILTVLNDYLADRPSKAQQALMHHFLVMEPGGSPRSVAA